MNADSATKGEQNWRRRVQRSARRLPPIETMLAILAGLGLWMLIAPRVPDYVLPPLGEAIARSAEVFIDPDQRFNWLMTVYRILLGLVSAFVVGLIGGLLMGGSKRLTNILMPYLQVIQGIPSMAWVVIAIIWFQEPEIRIWFLMLMVTLPGFAFQTRDSYQAIPQDLKDMAKSLRPRRHRLDMFRTVTLPGIIPGLLTAWRVNLGLGTRVVIIAEFAGTSIGVGYQLRAEQQFYRMDGVIAWTASLVIFVIVVQYLISLIESRLLRYRPGPHTPAVTDASQQPAAGDDAGGAAATTGAAAGTGRPGRAGSQP